MQMRQDGKDLLNLQKKYLKDRNLQLALGCAGRISGSRPCGSLESAFWRL